MAGGPRDREQLHRRSSLACSRAYRLNYVWRLHDYCCTRWRKSWSAENTGHILYPAKLRHSEVPVSQMHIRVEANQQI